MSVTDTLEHRERLRSEPVGRAGISAIVLLAANAGIIFLYIAYDLSLSQLAVIYWWECLWIGLFCAVKMMTASIIGNPFSHRSMQICRSNRLLLAVLAIGFIGAEFLTLYFFLGIAIVQLTSMLNGVHGSDIVPNEFGLLFGLSMLFLIAHGFSYFVNFLTLNEYKAARAGTLLTSPIRRCLALLAATGIAFGAAYAVPELAKLTEFAILLIVLKLVWDLRLHISERRAFRNALPYSPR